MLDIRGKEIKVLRTAAYLNAATSFIWACAPFLVNTSFNYHYIQIYKVDFLKLNSNDCVSMFNKLCKC